MSESVSCGSGGDVPPVSPSTEEPSDVCETCKGENVTVPAVGWCESCDELLCDTCYKTHCRPKKMRDHQLWSMTEMKKRKEEKDVPHTCAVHDGKHLKEFCQFHSKLCCSRCIEDNHRFCKQHLIYIDDVKTIETEEFKRLKSQLSKFDSRLRANGQSATKNGETIAKQFEEIIADINDAGEKLKTNIDRLVKEQIDNVETIRDDSMRNMADIEDIHKVCLDKLKAGRQMLDINKDDNNRLFIAMKQLQRDVESLDKQLQEAERKNKVTELEFVFNTDIVSNLEKTPYLGILNALNTELVTQEVGDTVELRRFKQMSFSSNGWGYRGLQDAIQVSTNHDIRLLSVLLYPCIQSETSVALDVFEGCICLIRCKSAFSQTDREVVNVDIVKVGEGLGIVLHAGHRYDMVVKINGNSSAFGNEGIPSVIADGVMFAFSRSQWSTNKTEVSRGQIAGFRFTRL